MAQVRKTTRAKPFRTLFEPDYLKHAPGYRKFPYPLIIREFAQREESRFGGYEASIFDDVLDYEHSCYLGSHTLMAGPITIQIPGKRSQVLDKIKLPYEVPAWVEPDGLRISKSRAKGVLLIVNATTFSGLLRANAPSMLNMIMVCSMGIPRVPTRRLLHRLGKEHGLWTFLLADNSTWGYFIFSVLKRGLLAPHGQCPYLAVSKLRYLGLRAGDWKKLGLNRDILISWKPHWSVRLKRLRKYSCFQSREWQDEFEAFNSQKGSLEVAAPMGKLGHQEFLNNYLQKRLAHRDFIS